MQNATFVYIFMTIKHKTKKSKVQKCKFFYIQFIDFDVSAIWYSVISGNTESIKLLLSKPEIDINIQSNDGIYFF